MKKIYRQIIVLCWIAWLASCTVDKYPLPNVPDSDSSYANIGKEVYNLIYPILDAENGYSFNHPSDIYVGVDNFIYLRYR
jgi:hypothetical protein